MNTSDWNVVAAYRQHRRHALPSMTGTILSVVLIACVSVFACWVVGSRPLDIGTDTQTYAQFFERLGNGPVETRLEPGFVVLSMALRELGLDIAGYQAALFATMLLTVFVAVHVYHRALDRPGGELGLLSAALMLLFVSPMFVNASINAIRQGLASLIVFSALLSFQQRRWWQFVVFGAVATSLHLSSLLYLLCAPVLLLRARWQAIIAALAFLAYISGLSMKAVGVVSPALYGFVMEYTANDRTRSGVRVDFAVFSIFWYLLAWLVSPLVHASLRKAFRHSTAVYVAMLLPFFAVGWGFFSNRYLLPALLAASVMFAAVVRFNRISGLRHPFTIRLGLIASCGLFAWYVGNGIVV